MLLDVAGKQICHGFKSARPDHVRVESSSFCFPWELGTGHKLEGGGLVQTWGGPLFCMQAKKGGSNNLVHVIKGGAIIFYAKLLGSRSRPRIPL